MSEYTEQSGTMSLADKGKAKRETGPSCGDIRDPIKKALCKMCHKAVLETLPFCQEGEPPVP